MALKYNEIPQEILELLIPVEYDESGKIIGFKSYTPLTENEKIENDKKFEANKHKLIEAYHKANERRLSNFSNNS